MMLIEREGLLSALQTKLQKVTAGEGHCVFLGGDAGIGKTSLVKVFCKEQEEECVIYQGACDSLFTPRPLAPLYDIMWQINSELWPDSHNIEDRSKLFAEFFREVSSVKGSLLIIFEDIQWADEATLDFIKFFARRITKLRCLFILTYRDNEISSKHPLRNVMGQLPPDSFTRLQLQPLSREAVDKMALEKGYSGEDIYSITGGNPFYVTEILSSYNDGVPDNIRDAILSAFNKTEEKARQVWEVLSVSPMGFELKYLEKLVPSYATSIENCLELKILYMDQEHLYFKHELFRRTIENSLSPIKRISLNKKILELFKECFEEKQEIERIIHHAKNANEYELVAHYAPIAARHASLVGAHTESSKLYLTAIEYYQGNDKDILIRFYESYAYECFLTKQLKDAIIYTGKALSIWKEKGDLEKTGKCLRFLSRLWWLDGHSKNAIILGEEAVECLAEQPSSPAKAMVFSNMSQLKMLFDQPRECITWGEKAIAIAKELGDNESLSHALNNVGSVYTYLLPGNKKGNDLLQQSLAIALSNSLHEHAARAYSNLGSSALKMKNFDYSRKILDEGLRYCEERNLDSSRAIILSLKADLELETGDWKNAFEIADSCLYNGNNFSAFTIVLLSVAATIKMRKGEPDALPLVREAIAKSIESMELQRIIPAMVLALECEWLTGNILVKSEDLERNTNLILGSIYNIEKNEFVFWLQKTRKQKLTIPDVYVGYNVSDQKNVKKAAVHWENLHCPYWQALVLFEGNDDDKRKAIKIVHDMGATAVYEKMKMEMRNSGIKSIPRGLRQTTQANAAQLTLRELDVLQLLKEGLQNKEIAGRLYISAKTVDHHISSILFKLDVNSRTKAVKEALSREIIK